ncbi:MAG: hypothetical protein Q9M11_03600 [Mariprofundaceae bacterium]|nr:hypothetical protein [Mariprofundaceae bacterium]
MTNQNKADKRRRKSNMIYLDKVTTNAMLDKAKMGECINIQDTLLARDAVGELNTVFGPTISIQRAIDYVLMNDIGEEHLLTKTLAKTTSAPGTPHNHIPNYWAYLGYLVVERITQTPELRELLLEDKPLIDAVGHRTIMFAGTIDCLIPNTADSMYIGVVRAVVKALRDANTPAEEVVAYSKVIQDLKKYRNKSVFEGMRFSADHL